jgi:ATP-dependent DNA helicase RecG
MEGSPMSALSLQMPLSHLHLCRIPRVGPQRARALAAALADFLGLADPRQVTLEDLLLYLPLRYEDRSHLARVAELRENMWTSIEVVVRVTGSYAVKGGQLTIFELSATDETGQIRAFWWNRPWLQKTFPRGARVILYGQWRYNAPRRCFEVENPDFEVLTEEDDIAAAIHTGRRVPIYRKLGPFTTRPLRAILYHLVQQLTAENVPETLPEETRRRLHPAP